MAERNYAQEKRAHKTAEYRRDNAARKRARRAAEKKGLVSKGDGKEVDHKKMLASGGSNEGSNLRVVSRSENRKRQPPTKKRGKARGKQGE